MFEKVNTQQAKESKRFTFKIWAILFVSLCTIFIVFFLNYINFQNLSKSLDDLSQPNDKLNLINEIFQDIADADNQIQNFILTNDSSSWDSYSQSVSSTWENIGLLKNLINNDSIQMFRVDSLYTLFEDKQTSLEEYLEIKKLQQSRLFSNEILSEIANQLNDTTFIERELMRSDIITGTPIKEDSLPNLIFPDNYKGLGGFIRRVYSENNTNPNNLELQFTYDVLIDTSIIRDYFPDTTLLAVKGILNRVMDAEAKFRSEINRTELAFHQNDEVFLKNIKGIITLIKNQELEKSELSKSIGKATAERSNFIILITGIIGLLLSGTFAFFIFLDFNKSSQLRKQILIEKEKAEKLAKVKEQFLANMSHEIRTPLHNIIGFSSLLNHTPLDEKQKGYLEAISKSNHYLKDLLDNILDNSKIDNGKIELVNRPFDLINLLEEFRNIFSYSVLEKDLDFICDFPVDLKNYYIITDQLRLKQVLNNLLHNAVKFTNNGFIKFQVTAEIVKNKCELLFIVSDSGIGISNENINRIFNLFEQENSSIHQNFGGTGLGLSIAKGFVELMGGNITVTSKEGIGTTFKIKLEVPYIEAPKNEIKVQSSEKKYFKNISVLLIEDDGWNALLFKELISGIVSGLKIFNNGRDAINWLENKNHKVDIVFTDINMPIMNGFEFLAKIRQNGLQIPIVAITAHRNENDLKNIKSEGFDHVCSKPFQLSVINNILNLYFNSDPEKYTLKPNEINDNSLKSIKNKSLLDFTLINSFASNDHATFINLLTSLAENNENQLSKLKQAILASDSDLIAFCCHQMKTTYDTLNEVSVSEDLETIELLDKLGNSQKVIYKAQEILPRLIVILDQLKMAMHQYQTSLFFDKG